MVAAAGCAHLHLRDGAAAAARRNEHHVPGAYVLLLRALRASGVCIEHSGRKDLMWILVCSLQPPSASPSPASSTTVRLAALAGYNETCAAMLRCPCSATPACLPLSTQCHLSRGPSGGCLTPSLPCAQSRRTCSGAGACRWASQPSRRSSSLWAAARWTTAPTACCSTTRPTRATR